MNYIERTTPTSNTCNTDSNTCINDNETFKYLKDFNSWNDEKKTELMLPMIHIIDTFSYYEKNVQINMEIASISLKTGRSVHEYKFEISNNGIITPIIIFNAIRLDDIPDSMEIKSDIIDWYYDHKYIDNLLF